MRILSFLFTFVIVTGNLLTFPKLVNAQGIVASGLEVALAPMVMGIGILQIFITLFLFLFIPIAFIGMILRLIGFKKESNGVSVTWRWNIKQSLARFLKYIIYHAGLFGIWFIILKNLTGYSYITPPHRRYGHYDLLESATLLINNYLVMFLIYAVVWALIAPYIVYFWNKLRNNPTFKPSIGSHIRLLLWNIFIFLSAGIFFTLELF